MLLENVTGVPNQEPKHSTTNKDFSCVDRPQETINALNKFAITNN